MSSLAKDERSSGTAMCSLVPPKCPIYASLQCFNTTPYSVFLGSKLTPTVRIDFQPSDLYSVIVGLTNAIKANENFKYPEHIDVPVWGGKERICITRLVDTEAFSQDPEEYLGVRISQVNPILL